MSFRRASEQLDIISQLEDGWNGNTAKAFSIEIIEKCRRILNELPSEPEIFPTACDSIQFEYEKDNGEYLEFEIYKDEIKMFAITRNNKTIEEIVSEKQMKRAIIDFYKENNNE